MFSPSFFLSPEWLLLVVWEQIFIDNELSLGCLRKIHWRIENSKHWVTPCLIHLIKYVHRIFSDGAVFLIQNQVQIVGIPPAFTWHLLCSSGKGWLMAFSVSALGGWEESLKATVVHCCRCGVNSATFKRPVDESLTYCISHIRFGWLAESEWYYLLY